MPASDGGSTTTTTTDLIRHTAGSPPSRFTRRPATSDWRRDGPQAQAYEAANLSSRTGPPHSVLYARTPRLLEDLAVARADGRYPRLLASLAKDRLLILDDWAITPMTADQRRDLLDVVEDRCGRTTTLVASQIPVAEWHAAIGDATLADAILGRLVHASHRIEIRGVSIRKRLAEKTRGA